MRWAEATVGRAVHVPTRRHTVYAMHVRYRAAAASVSFNERGEHEVVGLVSIAPILGLALLDRPHEP